MKRLFLLISAWMAFSTSLFAQETASAPQPRASVSVADPSVRAMKESQHLQQVLDLDARQTKKVYKFFHAHFKNEISTSRPFGGPGGPVGPGGPGGPGRDGFGMMGGPGGPDMTGGRGGMRPRGVAPGREFGMHPQGALGPADAGKMQVAAEEWHRKQAKKFRKIFTDEQYAAWERMRPQAGKPEDPRDLEKPERTNVPSGDPRPDVQPGNR